MPFLVLLLCFLLSLGALFILYADSWLAVISISILYIAREIVRFKRHVTSTILISSILWMPIFVVTWMYFGERVASLSVYFYAAFVSVSVIFKFLTLKVDPRELLRSYRLLPSALVDQSFSSGINLVYINSAHTPFAPLFVRAISVADVLWNILGSHILSRAGRNSARSVARFLAITSRKTRFFLIIPICSISVFAALLSEPKLAFVCIMKGVKYFVGWGFKILLLLGRTALFNRIHIIFATLLVSATVLIQADILIYVMIFLGIVYQLIGYYYSSRSISRRVV